MAPALSKEAVLAASGGVVAVMGMAGYAVYRQVRSYRVQRSVIASGLTSKGKRAPIAVNSVFLKRFIRLLKIVIPSLASREMGWLTLVAVMLGARTYCDLWMIRTTTNIERIIIGRMRKQFPVALFSYFLGIIPLAAVNNLLKYGLNEMSLCFRERLTEHFYDQYMKGFTYYTIQNVDGRLTNPDQILTQDVEKFCQSIADLYSNVSKPLIDMVIYAYKLAGAIGIQGPFFMLGYLAVSGVMLTSLRRPLGRYTVWQQELEGEFRTVNSRLLTNSEEIAFYQGNTSEKRTLRSFFKRLISHVRHSMQFRFSMGILDSIIAKYLSLIVGFYVVSRPFLDLSNKRLEGLSHGERMQDYYRSGRMLMSLAGAVGRLTLATRELTRLAGFTERMSQLQDVLLDLNAQRYRRTVIEGSLLHEKPTGEKTEKEQPEKEVEPGKEKSMAEESSASTSRGQQVLLVPRGQTIEVPDRICFQGVPLITPNGDVLVRELNLEVKSGMNVLVCGPNGCGKSSLFRVLGGLWPLSGGVLHKPPRSELFYVPQRPYMPVGTLRDQIIYPRQDPGMSDQELVKFLKYVNLEYLLERYNWDDCKVWNDVLSGGEKQRVALARLFFNKPSFAILDECTSAVSVDVEASMYKLCRQMNITLFTISHRKSLWVHHEYILYFDGQGAYTFGPQSELGDINFGS